MDNSGGFFCAAISVGIAILAGALAAGMLIVVASWTLGQAIFAGIVLAIILSVVLVVAMCGPSAPMVRPGEAGVSTQPMDAAATEAMPTADLEPEQEVAAAVEPEADIEPETPSVAEPAAELEPEPAPEPAPEMVAEPVPATAPEPEPEAAAQPEAEDIGTRPAALEAAREGCADDLKRIRGIGPKLEQLCNRLGFYHFDQIADWTADEVAWVDAHLEGFKGRVTRDNWVEQARVLAAGGATDFSKRVDDGDV